MDNTDDLKMPKTPSDSKDGDRYEFETDLHIHLYSYYPHVMGEDEPRKEKDYIIHLVKDHLEYPIELDDGAPHPCSFLTLSQGSSWKEAWDELFKLIEFVSKTAKVPLERVLGDNNIPHSEYEANMAGYEHGCDAAKNWSYRTDDFVLFTKAFNEGKNHVMTPERCSGSQAREVYIRICGRLGSGPAVSDYNSDVYLKVAEDTDEIMAAMGYDHGEDNL